MRRMGLMMLAATLLPGMAAAEDAWIRIEAKRGAAAEAAIAGWRARFPDVQTFDLPNGWTGIALGPQDAAAAAGRMAQLKAAGSIPADSYLTAPGGTAPLAGALAASRGAAPAAAVADPLARTDADAAAGGVAADQGSGDAAAPIVNAAGDTHIQLQATPGRISADEALARWRRSFPEAGLWRLPNGMFAVALSAESEAGATARLAALKAARRVPSDAYLAQTAQLGTVISAGAAPVSESPPADAAAGEPAQITPEVGSGPLTTAEVPPAQTGPADMPAAAATDIPAAAPATSTQTGTDTATAAGAASTAGLTAAPPVAAPEATAAAPDTPEPPAPAVMPPMDEVQRALRWAGFYDGPVDGKSGPGTRAAIDAEVKAQAAGQPPAEAMVALLARREAWRAEMGLTRLDDPATGLGTMAPMNRLAFDRVERGLSIYGPKDGSGAALILMRQPGGQQQMLDFAGLVTALGWVPSPQRQVASGRVSLEGAGADHHGHAEARVADGQVEGWVLIWPQADAANAKRLAAEIGDTLSLTPVVEATPAEAPAQDAAPGTVTAPATP